MKPGRLARLARRLTELLGDGSGLAGGLAVAAWGEIRATRDVDFVTTMPLSEVERLLTGAGLRHQAHRGDPLSGDLPWVVRGEVDGVPFQVFAPRGGRSFSTIELNPPGLDGVVRVVDLGDLIRLKLEAAGPKDLWDVARLLARYPERRVPALEEARLLGVAEELARWMTPRPAR